MTEKMDTLVNISSAKRKARVEQDEELVAHRARFVSLSNKIYGTSCPKADP